MNKKDQDRMEQKLEGIETELRALEFDRMKRRLRTLADIVLVVAAIIAFFEILFHNPDMNYLIVLIPTCAITGVFMYRAFSNGGKATETRREILKLEEESLNLESKLKRAQ